MMNIELIETETLIQELLKRFDASCFVGVRHKYKSKDTEDYTIRYRGSLATLKGLNSILENHINMDLEELIDEEEKFENP